MVVKGYVVKKLKTNKYLVRIPLLENISGSSSLQTASLLEATAVMNPGTLNIYKEGDCVFISFEGGNKGKPVIIGLLYKGNEDKEPARAHQYNDSLTITNKAKLPINTTIGKITYQDLITAINSSGVGEFAPIIHNHPISEIINLQEALDSKASVNHNHDTIYAPITHSHSISQVTGLQAELDDLQDQITSSSHSHTNLSLLETYTQTEANLSDAVSKKHNHLNKTILDNLTQGVIDNSHIHSNKALLDSYTQTDTDILDAVTKKHTHTNKLVLDNLTQSIIDKAHGHSTTEQIAINTISGLQAALDSKASALTEAQLKAVNSGIDAAKVTKYEEYDTGKQNILTEAQQLAVDSGISASKVSQYDNYATEKQDKLSPSQQSAVDSGITEEKVSKYDGYEASIAGKQDQLSTAQQNAIDSGITSEKVSSYDGYSTSKQDKLSAEQQNAVDSGITSEKVTIYDAMVSAEKGMPLITGAEEINFTTEDLVYAVVDGTYPEQTGYDLTITTKSMTIGYVWGNETCYDNFYYKINDETDYRTITYPVTNRVIPNVTRVAFYYDSTYDYPSAYHTITGDYIKFDDYYWLNGPVAIEFQSSYPCFVKGTKITLADRSYKNVEDITYEDELLVWNFDDGNFTSAKPLWILKPQKAQAYNKLVFSDGSILNTVSQHRIFNVEKGKFTYPMTEDTPVGTTTFNDKGELITLVSKEVVEEEVEYYNIITNYHINLFASTILTSCRLSNLYPIKNMKYQKDNRELHSPDLFKEINSKWINGLRLLEQPLEVNRDNAVQFDNSLVDYVKRLEETGV